MNFVSCVSATFCMATSNGIDSDLYTYNGSTWGEPTLIDPGNPTNFYGISCASTTFCAVIDGYGNAIMYNGATWAQPERIDTHGTALNVSCTVAKFCAAVDDNGQLIAYNGTAWENL
jgi:hypothetical protein